MRTSRYRTGQSVRIALRQDKALNPGLTLVTGGSGSRQLAQRITQDTHRATYIINTTDSGGSSRQLRLLFDNFPAIGDLRSRLLDLAETDGPSWSEVTNLLRHRLPENGSLAQLNVKLMHIAEGKDPLILAVKNSLSPEAEAWFDIITAAFSEFQKIRYARETFNNKDFDPRNASLGNIFLAGIYFKFEKSLPAAIFQYERMAGVRGSVIPATLGCYHLAARMADRSQIIGQHRITNRAAELGAVKGLWYVDSEKPEAKEVKPVAYRHAVRAIEESRVLVFSVGSFWTSILSVLQIPEIAQAVIKSQAKKVFVANASQDTETQDMTVAAMADALIGTIKRASGYSDVPDSLCLNHVVANETFVKGGHLIDSDVLRWDHPAIDLLVDDLLLPGQSKYNPKKLSLLLYSFLRA